MPSPGRKDAMPSNTMLGIWGISPVWRNDNVQMEINDEYNFFRLEVV
jgi:hypothetical protein